MRIMRPLLFPDYTGIGPETLQNASSPNANAYRDFCQFLLRVPFKKILNLRQALRISISQTARAERT